MSEEEKKALWYFQEVLVYDEDIEQWKIIEKLIEKQEKEIKGKDAWIDTLEHNDKVYQKLIEEYERDFISKDKIREKIKYLEKQQEENRRELTKGIDSLWQKLIDDASDKIYINYRIREILKNLLEEE